MKILITGAAGLVGAETVRQAVLDDAIDEIILLVRNQPEITHPKITVVQHKDFLNYTVTEEYFKRADALIWCLGISQTQVSKEKYIEITYDYTIACAKFCLQVNPSIRFVFVSGDGADRTEKSRTLFSRIKGKTENALFNCGLKNVIIARPDAVNPRHKNPKAPFLYKLIYPLFPLVEKLAPSKIIWSDTLAKALLHLAKNAGNKNSFENIELRELGK
ncbi:MAG: NAD-dependent epimerase/dehydratase family protein [Sphingobacteriales bacterium]|nr:MAG: NAD-dependent epimerase/dehydratase family protein [Sphingobacteriales bacterium]